MRIVLVDFRGLACEGEARHHVRHDAKAILINLAAEFLAIRLIGEAQHRSRMGVVDIFVRQEGVQQRFHRRIGRHGIDETGALNAHHLLIGQRIPVPQA